MGATRIGPKTGPHADLMGVRRCAERIRDEFLEMSDMALTTEQACRLWSADGRLAVCQALHVLVGDRFLVVKNGRYRRAE